MKEQDLEKCLDKLIIKGLIQEAEQDNAEFETAMREMSDEDFLALIYDTAEEPDAATMSIEKNIITDKTVFKTPSARSQILLNNSNRASYEFDESDEWAAAPQPSHKPQYRISGNKRWKIWAGAIASVAAILLIVLVPAHIGMDSRLCESALLASEAYVSPSRGIDITSMSKDELQSMLPELEQQYYGSIDRAGGGTGETGPGKDDSAYYSHHDSLQEAGIELTMAYLKLGKKDQAIILLHDLEANADDPEFREYCRKMLEILE